MAAVPVIPNGMTVEKDGAIAYPGIGAFFEKFPVHAVTPMQIEMMRQPGGGGGRNGILIPAPHRIAYDRGHAGNVQAVMPVELSGPSFGNGFDFPQPIQERKPFLQMVAAVTGPIAELGVQIVVITFPRWYAAFVGGPDGLEGNWRCFPSCDAAEFVGFPVPLIFQDFVREFDGRLFPESGPPSLVRLNGAIEGPAKYSLNVSLGLT